MKKTIIASIAALVLALSMSVGMAAYAPREAVLPPSPDGWTDYIDAGVRTGTGSGAEAELAKRGTIETVVKSVAEPAPADPKAVARTSYGTVDWSTAARGDVGFTATGKARAFILYAPDGTRAYFTVARGKTVKAALVGGDGTYKYAIATREADGYDYIDCKGSFRVTLDSDLAPYLVSTPYGDWAVELSSWTAGGVTYSRGAWVTIESTSGSVLWPSQADDYAASYAN